MPRKWIRAEVARLRRDNRSGAADLTLRAIEIFRRYVRTTPVKEKAEFLQDLRELCGGLMFAQSAMSSMQNACVEVLSTLTKHRDRDNLERVRDELEKKLSQLSRQIVLARQRIATHFSKVLPNQGRILTISCSSTVVGVLRELKRRGKNFEVIVMESRPMFEGRQAARELVRARIRTTLIADAAVGEYSKGADLAVVGADAVFNDGTTVNKIGTFPLALCCHEARRPFYVLADSSKLNSDSARSFTTEEKKPAELLKVPVPGLSVKNIYFELTPRKYITAIITEIGMFSPRTIRRTIK